MIFILDEDIPQDVPRVSDPHHGGSCQWCFFNGKFWHRVFPRRKWYEVKRVSITPQRLCTLASLCAEEGKVRKVLEAAKEQARLGAETHCDNHSVYFAACADTNKAVRERRGK